MVGYDYTAVGYVPNLSYIESTVQDSDMTSKALEYCEYAADSSVFSVYFTSDLNDSDKTTLDQIAADSTGVGGARATRKIFLKGQAGSMEEGLFSQGDQNVFITAYEDSLRYKPNVQQYLQPWMDWHHSVQEDLHDKEQNVDDATSVDAINAINIDVSGLTSSAPDTSVAGVLTTTDDTSLASFLNSNAVVTDATTGISGPYYLMEILNHRKDLYNDSTNPLYDASHTPILGNSGWGEEHANRILTLENIHDKTGWHNQEVQKAEYTRPRDLLIYYGWLNSFNSATHGWNNEKVAQEIAQYRIAVFGDGIQNPSHGDYANTKVIIPRVKALNPDCLMFGYVTIDQSLGDFTGKVDQWGLIGQMDGIFLDEAGYDYGRTRSQFNQRVDYVHDRTDMNLCFANAWNTNNILGTANDPSYPNSTYNDTSAESNLTENDWILLESFPINTASWTDTTGYESKSSWATRGSTMLSLRASYAVNFAGVGIINNSNSDGTNLFNFGYVSSLMWSLESFGTSDTYYGASSAAVKMWVRPDVYKMGKIWSLNPTIQNDVNDSDVYHRYTETAKLSLDFSDGTETSTIMTW